MGGVLKKIAADRHTHNANLGHILQRASVTTTSPVFAAYNDAFEVVIFELRDGAPTSFRSVPLTEADRATRAGVQAALRAVLPIT